MNTELDLLCDQLLHVGEVSENLEQIASELRKRGIAHDRTKFQEGEFDAFVSTREKFKKANYGTPEYQECIDTIKPAIDHHYEHNRHHPDHYEEGVITMNLVDILEMLADWKAAARRNPDKRFEDTIMYAMKKAKMDVQLQNIVMLTLIDLGWINRNLLKS